MTVILLQGVLENYSTSVDPHIGMVKDIVRKNLPNNPFTTSLSLIHVQGHT